MTSVSLRSLALSAGLLALAACGGEAPPPAATAPAAPASAAFVLKAPGGDYQVDPYHSNLTFKVRHLGLADYVARFTRFDARVTLDPAQLANSRVEVSVDPTSVRTDFSGDFKATHKDSPYDSFDERLSREAQFFNSDNFKTIAFKSTKVEPAGEGRLKVTGDLTFLGQTHPVTLDAVITGSMDQHPFTQRGAIGISAVTTLTRSAWGMTGTQQFVGDAVTVEFNGEFQQAVPPAAPN